MPRQTGWMHTSSFLREILIYSAALAFLAEPIAAAPLRIELDNVRNSKGLVHAEVCPRDAFLRENCPFAGQAQAQLGTVFITIPDVPPGRYAVQGYHDENRNQKVDRNFLGIPKEGVAFSNDARIVFGPPKFSEAAFDHGSAAQTIRMRMRYLLGPSGSAGKGQ